MVLPFFSLCNKRQIQHHIKPSNDIKYHYTMTTNHSYPFSKIPFDSKNYNIIGSTQKLHKTPKTRCIMQCDD